MVVWKSKVQRNIFMLKSKVYQSTVLSKLKVRSTVLLKPEVHRNTIILKAEIHRSKVMLKPKVQRNTIVLKPKIQCTLRIGSTPTLKPNVRPKYKYLSSRNTPKKKFHETYQHEINLVLKISS
jgi:hypothetical protein